MAREQTQHVSLRIEEATIADLDRLARQTGTSRNALAGRYISEGAKMDEFPQIYFRSGALGRRAALLGTRLDVWQVIETLRNHGNSIEETAAYLDLPAERVRTAVRYYAAQRGEVDEIAARERAAAERAEQLWRAEQEVLVS
jgi:uncharacterized protein (DUF433 family)